MISSFPSMAQDERAAMAFVSDTQSPLWVEDIFLHSNQNEKATRMIFSDLVVQRPQALFILGDVVALGYKKKKWVNVDRYLKACRDSGIYVTAVLGNHDVMTRPKKGETYFQERFNDHVHTGFVKVIDSIAVILLNSNFSKMSAGERQIQAVWLKNTLQALDHDPGIYSTIVTCHHSPYTNSKIVRPNTDVQKDFVPSFMLATKARLFITGHSHNFESFGRNGKRFLVIGGGGGLHQPLRPGTEDMVDEASAYKPMFHYLLIQRGREGLHVTSKYLEEDFSGFAKGITFIVPY